MPLADCLRPFNQSDRHKVQPLINELRQAVGDDHLLGIQTELFEVLLKIVGNFPLSSGSGYFWPGSYIDFSLKLSRIALNLLRQRIQFFTMPLAQKEFETQLLKLLVLTICFFLNLRITAMTFCVAAENGDEFRFEVPYEDWFKEHEGQELTLYHNVDPDPEAAAGNINRLVLKYLPESLQKRFAKSFKRGYLALLSKFIRGDVGSIVKDEFILILISQAESILREQMTIEFARKGEEPPHYIPSILSWAICALLANELSPEAALRKSDAIGNKEPLQIVARAITCKDGEIYAVIEYFFPLLTAKLQELFPRQTWREKEVLRMCCQCGIFDLKEGATFEEVANRIEIYKKCGKEVVSTPVQGLRFNNFLLYVANDSYFGRTVQSLQAKHSVDANDKKLKELGLHKPVAKWQWQDKKLMMERLKPYFEEVLAPKTDEDRERREFFDQLMEKARKRWKEEGALKEAEEAKVPPAILAQRKADLEHALRAFEEAKEKFDCEFNVKKKQAKNKKAKSKEAAAKTASEEASAETTKTEEPAKEMSNSNLIVVQKSEEPSVPKIQTSHAIKVSCKLVFNALCHDTSRFFKGVGECFSVHSWLAKRGYRLVRIDSEESSPSNAQNKPEVKQIPCGSRKAGANEENSSVIVIAATEAPVTEVQTPTAQETGVDTEVVETVAEKSSEVSKTAASENTTITPVETVDQTTSEESMKISREVANPELQQRLVQRLNESVEKSSIHPEKLADMEMDAEIKRLASLKNKDKSDNLSDNKTSQEAKANAKENSVVKTGAQSVAQQTGPSSSSNAQSKSDEPSDSKNPSVDSASETSSGNDAEKPKAKRDRKKKADTQTANAPENAVAATHTKQAASQKASSEAKPASAAKPKANTAASGQPKSNAAPSDQNPPKAKRGRKPKALQSANSQASSDAAKSKEVSVVQAAKVNKAAKTAKSAAQPKDSVKPAEKTAKAATQAKAEAKPVLKAPAKTPSSGKSSAKAIQAALTA